MNNELLGHHVLLISDCFNKDYFLDCLTPTHLHGTA